MAAAVGPAASTRAVASRSVDTCAARVLCSPARRPFAVVLARNLDAWATNQTRERRGARRVDMFNEALKDANVTGAKKTRLVAALSTATGSEAMIGLYDIAKVDQKTAEKVVIETAEALLDKFGVTE